MSMKPNDVYFGYGTIDLTQGNLHRYEDGRVVARFPKTWHPLGTQKINAANGEVHNVTMYFVDTWEELPLLVGVA